MKNSIRASFLSVRFHCNFTTSKSSLRTFRHIIFFFSTVSSSNRNSYATTLTQRINIYNGILCVILSLSLSYFVIFNPTTWLDTIADSHYDAVRLLDFNVYFHKNPYRAQIKRSPSISDRRNKNREKLYSIEKLNNLKLFWNGRKK